MPPEEFEEERRALIDWLEGGLADPGAFATRFALLALALGALALSVQLLRLLHRHSPRIALPPPRWSAFEALVVLLGWFLVQVLCAEAARLVFPSIHAPEIGGILRVASAEPLAHAQVAAAGIGGLAVAGWIVLLPVLHAQPLTALGIGTGSLLRGACQGVLVYAVALPGLVAAMVLWLGLLLLIGIDAPRQPAAELLRESIGTWGLPVVLAMVVGVAPIAEELLFRGLLHRSLARRFGVPFGVICSSLLFGAVHANLLAFVPVSLLGAVLALEMERTGSIWSCIALHAAFNAGHTALMLLGAGLG
jgi:membrane protease YdiL (CAAX protease family)